MKATNDKEMELLLGRHAQRIKTTSAAGAARANEGPHGHLDADEMNAFAENGLPESARTRYVSHLADCDSCRKLAAELTMTTSAAARLTHVTNPERSFLSSLGPAITAFFSFPAIRYVVPALAVVVLVTVAFVALRHREQREFVAQNEPASTAKPADVPTAPFQGSSANRTATPLQRESGQETSAKVNPAKDAAAEKVQSADIKQNTSGYAGAANAQQPGFAPEPNAATNERDEKSRNVPAAVPAAKPEPSNSIKLADKASADEPAPAARDTLAAQKEEQFSKRNRDAGLAAPPKSGIVASEVKSKGGPRRAREQSESEGRSSGTAQARTSEVSQETRKVSGHTFYLQNRTWVDAAYTSSLKLTTLTRGSDKYRSIVNDEPGLRAIAEQLGDVVVVWNGKAYRIH
jgi:hypothetical protein